MTDIFKEGMTHEEMRTAVVKSGGNFSGNAIENFKRGWAMMGFKKHKPHYYVEVDLGNIAAISRQGRHRLYESLCGVQSECSERAPAFEPGNFSRCANCMRLAQKRMPLNLWKLR